MAKATIADIRKAILREVPGDGNAIGNFRLRERVIGRLGTEVTEPDVGVVTPETDPKQQPRTAWACNLHIDPALQLDVGRAQIESLIDGAPASGDEITMREPLKVIALP